MARVSVETLPSAPVDAIATGSLLLVDDNGVPYKVAISDINSGGGTGASLLVRTDTTPVVTGRLLSPGNLVEGLNVTLSLDGAAAKTAVTDANGDFTYDFTPYGTRGLDHTLKVTASSFLIKNITGWHWDLLAANTVAPVTTGSALVGSTLSVNPGTWANNPTTFLYRWLRGSYLIPGANASTYVLQEDDDFDNITAQVAAVNTAGTSAWVSANAIGPIAYLDTAVTTAPSLSGTSLIGSEIAIVPGVYTNFAKETAFEWQADGVKINDTRSSKRYYAQTVASNGTFPQGDNYTRAYGTSAYNGSNTNAASLAAFATENDYYYLAATAAGGQNDGAQLYSVTFKQGTTNSQTSAKVFLARVDSTGTVVGSEVQMIHGTLGTGFIPSVGNSPYTVTVTNDFGAWNSGDFLRVKLQQKNTGSGSNNYNIDPISGASYIDVPWGAYTGLALGKNKFTSRSEHAGKSIAAKVTYSNSSFTHNVTTAGITLEASGAQTLAPANLIIPAITATETRVNVAHNITLGSWNHQPTTFAMQVQLEATLNAGDWANVSGATTSTYIPVTGDVGKRIRVAVTATNGIGSTTAYSDPLTVLGPATYYDLAGGNDGFDGQTPDTAKQTLTGTGSITSSGSALLKRGSSWSTQLVVGASRTYDAFGTGGYPTIGTGVTFGIDQYTDGTQGLSNVTIKNLNIAGNQRGLQQRQGSNWLVEDCLFDPCGYVAKNENSQGLFFQNCNDITLRRVTLDRVWSDGIYLDNTDRVILENVNTKPVFAAEGDAVQLREDRFTTKNRGFIARGCFLDMASVKTSSGKGCLVTNMASYVYSHDNKMDGNNFVKGTDEGDFQVFCRNACTHALMNSYSFGYGIGGYDNQGGSLQHEVYDNTWYNINRAHSYSGISVSGNTIKPYRADIAVHDELIWKCANGISIDRPTSGIFRGIVFHNVTTTLRRTDTTVPQVGTMKSFTWSDHFIYKGVVVAPPPILTRAVITGTRAVGQTLDGTDTDFDTSVILAQFPGATITRSYQWRRHRPVVQLANWTEHLGYDCRWIDGATGPSYTIQTEDMGCLVSRVDRIHIVVTDGTVTNLAYDATYATSTPIARTGELATPMPVLTTTGTISIAGTALDAVVVNLPPLLNNETRTLLNSATAPTAYTGAAIYINADGDIARSTATLTNGSTVVCILRQTRGIDIKDYFLAITVTA
jgi:hypothetical protein